MAQERSESVKGKSDVAQKELANLLANYIPRIIVKLRNPQGLTPEQEIQRYLKLEQEPEQYLGPAWSKLAQGIPGLAVQKLITSVTPQRILELVKTA